MIPVQMRDEELVDPAWRNPRAQGLLGDAFARVDQIRMTIDLNHARGLRAIGVGRGAARSAQ